MGRKSYWLALLVFLLALSASASHAGRVMADDGGDESSIQETVGPFVDDVIIPAFGAITRLSAGTIETELQQGKSLNAIGAERGLYGSALSSAFLNASRQQVTKLVASGEIPASQQAEISSIISDNLAAILDAPYLNDTAQAAGPPVPASPSQGGPKRQLQVVATTVQITALAHAVGGDLIELVGIIPAGADPHEFEPVASDLVAIEGADVILRHGIGLDDWLKDTLSAGASAQVTTVTRGVRLRKGEEDGKLVNDPHVWHDPDNAARMVDNIAAAFASADPADEGAFYNNATAYKQVLDRTKSQVQALIDSIPADNRKLVTNHDALSYFGNAFGLKIVGEVIPSLSTQGEPSAKETAQLLDTIRREKVKAIFAESSVDPRLAKTLAKDAGVKVVLGLYADSMGEPGSGADTLDGMLLANAYKIADALK